jgi:mannosylglycerate hydrolase
VIEIAYTLPVPGDLVQRKAGIVDSAVDVRLVVTVPNQKPVLEVKFELDNQAREHRVRALIPTGIASSFSVADNQFGTIRRPVRDSALDLWEQEGWDERPDAIYPMLTFVGLSDAEHGVAVLTNSTREYQIVGDSYETIAVTLFRSVGVLGKENLERRPGRPSGIKLPTPDSQMLRRVTIDFAITTHAGTTLVANVARIAKEYLTPIQCYNKIPHDAMRLNPAGVTTPVRYSLLREMAPTVVLSTLKKAERSKEFLLRFYNATGEAQTAAFAFEPAVTTVRGANLNEQPQAALPLDGAVIVKPNQVKTILFGT